MPGRDDNIAENLSSSEVIGSPALEHNLSPDDTRADQTTPVPPPGLAGARSESLEPTTPSLLRLNARLRHADREYLIQSTVDPVSKRMRCDIFGEGVRLTAIDGEEIAGIPTESIFPALNNMHERITAELDRVFKLSLSALNAQEPALLNYIGELFASRRMWLEARREFDRAVLLAPKYDRALFNLGCCYLNLNLYNEAAEFLERAVAINQTFPDYLNRLGEAYLELSSCRKAIDQFRKAAQLNPYFWEPYFNMGLAHILNGIRREDYRMHLDLKRKAMDMFEKSAIILPALRSGSYFLGQRYLEEDRLAESYDAYIEAKSKAGGGPKPIPVSPLDLALCSDRFMPSEAELSAEISRLRQRVKIHPHYADLHFRLAQSYTILAQLVHQRSISEYERALKINPEFNAARRNKKLAENEDKGMSVLVKAALKSGRLSMPAKSREVNRNEKTEKNGNSHHAE
ncbi:tetratricopeptide repeat protein [Candidatus Zixiibacteriota bacterium]